MIYDDDDDEESTWIWKDLSERLRTQTHYQIQ